MIVERTDFSDEALRLWWQEGYAERRLQRNTYFQSWHWNCLWAKHFVENDGRRELFLLKVLDEDGIAAAAPLFLQKRSAGPLTAWRYLLFLADRLSQYTDLIVGAHADAAAVWRAVIDYVKEHLPDAWIELHDVLPDSTSQHLRHDVSEIAAGESYLRLPLHDLDAESLPARCAPHMKREILRARKRYAQDEALRWEALRNPDATMVRELQRLNRERFGAASWFHDSRNAVFFAEAVEAAGSEAVFTVLRHGSAVIHIMASWLHDGELLYTLSGLDEGYGRYSPGTMNLDQTICWAIAARCTAFDFLRGDEPYKREFAPEESRSMHFVFRSTRGTVRYRIARSAQRVVRRGREGGDA